MFIKMYIYKVRKKDLKEWKKMNGRMDRLLKKMGMQYDEVIRRNQGKFIKIIDLQYYKSADDFNYIHAKLAKNREMGKITVVFQKIASGFKESK